MSDWLPFGISNGIPVGSVGESGGIGDPGPEEWLVEGTATDLQGGNVRIREFVYALGKHIAMDRALTQHAEKHGLVIFDNPISPVLIWDYTKPLKVRTVFDTQAPPQSVVMPYKITRIHANLRRRIAVNRIKRDVKYIKGLMEKQTYPMDSSEYTRGHRQGWEDAMRFISPFIGSIEHEIEKCPTQED